MIGLLLNIQKMWSYVDWFKKDWYYYWHILWNHWFWKISWTLTDDVNPDSLREMRKNYNKNLIRYKKKSKEDEYSLKNKEKLKQKLIKYNY